MWEGAFRSDLAIEIGADGRIARIGPARQVAGGGVERLRRRALLPGFANAHSHSFQRLLRGRAQSRPAGAGADFWSWREAMLALASALTPDDVEAIARFTFLEMLRAGITSVGEFHYLRREANGRPYENRHEIADRVIAAAREIGLRIVFLEAAYVAGGIGVPLEEAQRRFATPDIDDFLARTDELRARWIGDPAVTVGVALHSVRAVPRSWVAPVAAWAEQRGAPLHAHVSEQIAEVEACVAAYGRRPVELLSDCGALGSGFTAVHSVHVDAGEVELLAGGPATVCACPTTERDLGDGILPAAELAGAGVALAIGTDSHVVIDPFEEMRALEGHERLRDRRRVVLGLERDGRVDSAPALLAIAAEGGARSLGIASGRIEVGKWADLIAVDLDHPALVGASADSLAAALALSARADVVADGWVAGARRLAEGRLGDDAAVAEAFARTAARVGVEADASGGRVRA